MSTEVAHPGRPAETGAGDGPFAALRIPRLAPGVDRTAAQEHIIGTHGPLVMTVPLFQGVFTRYSMNRVLDVSYGTPPRTLYPADEAVLVVVEHIGDSRRALAAAREDPAYLARVQPEEEYMARELLVGVPPRYNVREVPVFGEAAADGLRVFDVLKRRAGTGAEEFRTALAEEGERLAADADYRAAVRCRVHDLVEGTSDEVGHDALVVTWVRDAEALVPLRERLREAQAAFVDPAGSFSVITREHVVV